jgi:hypothetical protein
MGFVPGGDMSVRRSMRRSPGLANRDPLVYAERLFSARCSFDFGPGLESIFVSTARD